MSKEPNKLLPKSLIKNKPSDIVKSMLSRAKGLFYDGTDELEKEEYDEWWEELEMIFDIIIRDTAYLVGINKYEKGKLDMLKEVEQVLEKKQKHIDKALENAPDEKREWGCKMMGAVVSKLQDEIKELKAKGGKVE